MTVNFFFFLTVNFYVYIYIYSIYIYKIHIIYILYIYIKYTLYILSIYMKIGQVRKFISLKIECNATCCNSITWEAEAGIMRVRGQPGLHSEILSAI
jgi:hypothetical protein